MQQYSAVGCTIEAMRNLDPAVAANARVAIKFSENVNNSASTLLGSGNEF